tara:strand:+ start:16940 stop:19189 length:2250 start_codon:yes stop_codon:yes gene_type:complete
MVKKASRIAREARVACEKFREYFKYNIDQYHDMHEFVLGHQWEQEEEDMLVTNKKIPLTSNKLATLSNYLVGEQQQNTPQIQVVPMANATAEIAQLRELIVKDIMFSTDATTTYQVAASQAFIGGFGAFLIDTDYTHSTSFDQDIVYRFFKDATRCYWDVGAETINKTDGMVGGYLSRMTRPKFRQVYGKDIERQIFGDNEIVASKEEVALATDPSRSENAFNWADDNSICILHHYIRKFEKDTLYKLSNGNVVNQEEMDEIIDYSIRHVESYGTLPDMEDIDMMTAEANMSESGSMLGEDAEDVPGEMIEESNISDSKTEPEMVTLYDMQSGQVLRIEEKRDIKKSKIVHYKIAGDYILDEAEFAGEQIPVIFVDQNSYYDKDGRQMCRSFFADCRDTQRYINYLRTQSAYILKISRYDQFIASKKNVQGLDTQRIWKDPQAVQGALIYDESPNGNKPEQLRPPELSQSLMSQYELAMQDLYTSTGLYPTQMGAQGNEISGAAIDARSRQGSYATETPKNSINRAIAVGGQIVNEMIPRVYDAERAITLMTPEEGLKNFTINKQTDEYGAQIENDIRKGTFQVRLKPGPSYQGQKQQALESLQQVLQANPQTFALVADLYAENLPLANNIELKNRLKTLVPPEIIEAGKSGKTMPQNNKPNPEEQAAAMEAQFKQKELQLKEQELDLKKQKILIDAQLAIQKLETEKMEEAGKIEEQKMRYLAETQRTEADQSIAHANNMMKILTHKI